MNTPFKDIAEVQKAISEREELWTEPAFSNILLQPEKMIREDATAKSATNNEYVNLFPDISFADENQVDINYQVPTPGSRIKIGDSSFEKAEQDVSVSSDYIEPQPSGNPLFRIAANDKEKAVTSHFKVSEYARAEAGKYRFNYCRIDPVLADNLERLRNFLGQPVVIIDGYYTPKYLREVLRISDPAKVVRNPHIKGQGVKISVSGYTGMVKQIAMAALVACDKGINIGIGNSTMTLAVKQPLLSIPDPPPEDSQRIRSYITNEKIKITEINFVIDFKQLHHDNYTAYEKSMYKAMGAFAASILKIYFQLSLPAEWTDWKTPLGDAISLMYEKSKTRHPNVILYGLAYSPFGYLCRYYFKSKTYGTAEKYLIDSLTTEKDRKSPDTPGSFIYLLNLTDKSRFIELCINRIQLAPQYYRSRFTPAPLTFFNWTKDKEDKNFMNQMSQVIKDVFSQNGYHYDIPPQQLPVGGTRRNPKLSAPDPDKPVTDFTGRYWAPFTGNDPIMIGFYILINQAGNYISGKWGQIRDKTAVTDLKKTVTEFYGKLDEKGVATCNIYPQQTIRLWREQGTTFLEYTDNKTQSNQTGKLIYRSNKPVLSGQMVNLLYKTNIKFREVIVTLAWVHPPADKLKDFIDSFRTTEPSVKNAVIKYYNVEETIPNVKKNLLAGAISDLDSAINNYTKLPLMFSQFSNYYIRFVYSISKHWTPRGDKETMSTLDWIKKILTDYRDLRGSTYIEGKHKRLYEYFDIDTKTPDILYRYSLSIKLSAFGIGPFSRSSGEITITNRTDYNKYPAAQKWTEARYPIVLWNATLSLSPLTLAPKISAGQSIEAELETGTYYSATDFSGAGVQVTEGKVVEIPVSGDTGGVKIGTKIGIGGVVVLIDGIGKKTLEFESYQGFGIPDTIEIEPSDNDKEGTWEKISKFLPSLTMYKGTIDTKKTTDDLVSVPLADSFTGNYQIKDTRYFIHDDAALTGQAIEAIGRMCAEELIAFSDPSSEIEIYGHADASGDSAYNVDLSLKRAINVKQAIIDRLGGNKLRARFKKIEGLGEKEANQKYGQFTEKNAWLRRVVVFINGRAILSLGEL